MRQRPVGIPGEVPDGLSETGRVRQSVDVHPVLRRYSAIGHLFQVFGVPRPVHIDLRGPSLDFAEVVGRELDRGRPEVH
jgi:hypothetical protein